MMLAHVVKRNATQDDIPEIRKDMAPKERTVAPHEQVTSIETRLRDMRHVKLRSGVSYSPADKLAMVTSPVPLDE
jgi:hypothetical protein